ncbi:MAG: sigma-70 family RNA polymerase sigma factor [Ruminococcaceae bacterium]|nr:sigma-70 family RNA polymerase sigma factor [Oscillospiraceae bacterium]
MLHFFCSEVFSVLEKRLVKLIEDVKGGSDLAFSELCEDFSPLMKSQVLKLFGDNPSEYDDRLQDAAMALYNAVVTFDTSQDKVTFGLYAKICIRNRLISIKRKEKKNNKKSAPYEDAEKQLRETGRRASREKLEDNEKVISELSSYEKSVLMLYLNGHSYREIGLALDKSEKSVDNALYRIKSKLKKLI